MTKKQLIESLENLQGEYNISYQVIDDLVHITLAKKIDEFEEYCRKLDDDTFNKACLIFDITSDISLNEFSSNINNPDYSNYKKLFKKIVEFIRNY